MRVKFKVIVKETERAVCIPHNLKNNMFDLWIPKSVIKNSDWKSCKYIDFPDWLYMKKRKEMLEIVGQPIA